MSRFSLKAQSKVVLQLGRAEWPLSLSCLREVRQLVLLQTCLLESPEHLDVLLTLMASCPELAPAQTEYYAVLEDVLHEEVLHFSLWDHDFASKDDPLGNASLQVPDSEYVQQRSTPKP